MECLKIFPAAIWHEGSTGRAPSLFSQIASLSGKLPCSIAVLGEQARPAPPISNPQHSMVESPQHIVPCWKTQIMFRPLDDFENWTECQNRFHILARGKAEAKRS